ncbi:hypothetical protein WN51_10647 [Melipona quadrifasciata]|uniref:Uncharacterized protein n=1 Tax=Melipona quadrifasciata TaxID=166423 RepID=A0A0M8ZMT4_9HYME|nr:hypothetical protein WN51_10647 [Melipona quadrifasciata]
MVTGIAMRNLLTFWFVLMTDWNSIVNTNVEDLDLNSTANRNFKIWIDTT